MNCTEACPSHVHSHNVEVKIGDLLWWVDEWVVVLAPTLSNLGPRFDVLTLRGLKVAWENQMWYSIMEYEASRLEYNKMHS